MLDQDPQSIRDVVQVAADPGQLQIQRLTEDRGVLTLEDGLLGLLLAALQERSAVSLDQPGST